VGAASRLIHMATLPRMQATTSRAVAAATPAHREGLAWAFAGVLILSLTQTFDLPPRLRGWVAAPVGRALAALGFYSYSVYLWHMPVMHWLMPHLRERGAFAFSSPTLGWLADTAVYVSASIVAGYVMARIVEGPSLKLRDRLFPSRSGRVAALATSSRPRPLAAVA